MKLKTLLAMAAVSASLGASATPAAADGHINPFLAPYTNRYEIPPFDSIRTGDYLPALKAAVTAHDREIAAILNTPGEVTFDNTVLALDRSGSLLSRVVNVFAALEESNSSPEMVAVAEEFHPLLSQHQDQLMMNQALFDRINQLYKERDNLGLERDQMRLLEKYYKDFTRAGALLNPAQKEELSALNTRLTDLYLKFNKNLLSATNDFAITVTDSAQLAGLPESNIQVAAEEAAARGLGDNVWVFTLHAPSRLPVLQYARSRDLREKMYRGYTSLASSAPYDNRPVINDILKARAKKARLLGFKDFGSYMTDNVMAGTVDNARDLLMQIWQPAVNRVAQEVAEMQAIADAEGQGVTIQPWDYYYYNEKVRNQKYDLDENEVRAYFAVDSVRTGIFTMAQKLYGVRFTPMPDAPRYYDEVTVYDVTDAATGEHIAVFMTDYFPRASKRQGAWMSEFKGSWLNDDGTSSRPIIFNVGNFSKPTATTPSLLTIDELETMFHEFGHGLHGMLSTARYPGQSGTNVDRDFVELPSQIHEHWAMEPELLKVYAHHYKTGEVIPRQLIDKLQAASTHNQGFRTAELAGAALLDLEYGRLNLADDDTLDIDAFEQQVGDKLGLPAQLTYRYRSPYFKHVFGSNEYASGYYTYLWAEVLDCDGFELFKEKGIFDPETAASFKHNILEAGGSEDPMTLFVRFRGHKPGVEGLLKKRGLTPVR